MVWDHELVLLLRRKGKLHFRLEIDYTMVNEGVECCDALGMVKDEFRFSIFVLSKVE